MKISKDIDGEEWIEYDSLVGIKTDDICNILAENYYGQVEIKSNLLRHKNLMITIRVEKEENEEYFGFLLDISEEALIKTNSVSEMNNITDEIEEFIQEFYKHSPYEYAFCDNEAEIQYSPIEFKKIKKSIYSIVAIPFLESNSSKVNIIRSNWNIDGLTSRE